MKEIFKRNPKANTSGETEAKKSGEGNFNLSAEQEHKPKFSWSPLNSSADAGSPSPRAMKREVPDDLWIKCAKCKELIYSKEFENNKKVCHKCDYHARLGARERITQLLDPDSFEEINDHLAAADPLGFTSLAEPPYPEKALETRQKSGLNEAIVTGFGRLEGMALAVAVCDFSYQGGTMASVFGEKLARLVEAAIEKGLAVLTVSASGGARMHEGMFSLMQMAKTTAALARLGDYRLPHFSLLTDPVLGGVTASYATVADVIMAEPGAMIGFTGPRVIEQITKQKLPPGFQTAEFLLEHGLLDRVVPRKELRATLATLLKIYRLSVGVGRYTKDSEALRRSMELPTDKVSTNGATSHKATVGDKTPSNGATPHDYEVTQEVVHAG